MNELLNGPIVTNTSCREVCSLLIGRSEEADRLRGNLHEATTSLAATKNAFDSVDLTSNALEVGFTAVQHGLDRLNALREEIRVAEHQKEAIEDGCKDGSIPGKTLFRGRPYEDCGTTVRVNRSERRTYIEPPEKI